MQNHSFLFLPGLKVYEGQTGMYRTPKVVPYKDIEELSQLRDWFYDFNDYIDNRPRAIQKVSSYLVRGNVPHSIEITSLLTSTILLDDEKSKDGTTTMSDKTTVQLSYTMALIKFVNGLLDPYQKSNFALSLHKLAEILKLPSYFVELRHIGTHEYMPSVEMLRIASRNALNWLWTNYWAEVLQESEERLVLDKISQDQIFNDNISGIEQVTKHWKILRKIRKDDISKVIRFGDSSKLGKKYWDSMKVLKTQYAKDGKLFINVLLFKGLLLIVKEDLNLKKTNGIRLLYKPILEELGDEFNQSFLERLLELMKIPDENSEEDEELGEEGEEESIDRKLILDPQNLRLKTTNELSQAFKWAEYELSNALVFGKNSKTSTLVNSTHLTHILNILVENTSEQAIKLFDVLLKENKALFSKNEDLEKHVLKAKDNAIKLNAFKPTRSSIISNRKRPSEYEGDNDSELGKLKKRLQVKQESKEKNDDNKLPKEIYSWDVHADWVPIAFARLD